jgi:hypothetical protein
MLQRNLPDVFLDTDVAFDIISKRDPHFEQSVKILQLANQGIIRLVISEVGLANLFYLTFEIYKTPSANLTNFIQACEIVSSGKDTVEKALTSKFRDKEDALQYFTAIKAQVDFFLTRNKKDYHHKTSALPVYSPQELVEVITLR